MCFYAMTFLLTTSYLLAFSYHMLVIRVFHKKNANLNFNEHSYLFMKKAEKIYRINA